MPRSWAWDWLPGQAVSWRSGKHVYGKHKQSRQRFGLAPAWSHAELWVWGPCALLSGCPQKRGKTSRHFPQKCPVFFPRASLWEGSSCELLAAPGQGDMGGVPKAPTPRGKEEPCRWSWPLPRGADCSLSLLEMKGQIGFSNGKCIRLSRKSS